MSAWETADVAAALPTTTDDATAPDAKKNPQAHGWVAKTQYDYGTYMKSSKELAAEAAAAAGAEAIADAEAPPAIEDTKDLPAVGGLAPNDWACNGAKYEWNEEYGDVGPRFELLEHQLFGKENNHVRTGINFKRYDIAQSNLRLHII